MADAKHNEYPTVNADERMSLRQLTAYGLGGIIPIALFNIAGQLMGLIGNISLGLSAFWLGVIMIIPRLWDAISDPIVGHLSDNTRSRWGRRRPYLLVGGIAVAVSFVLMWWIPDGELVHSWFPNESAFQWFQLGYILFFLLLFFTACTIFEIPHGALGMEMTSDYHERTRLFSAKSFFGNLFAMSTPWLFALANMEIFKGPGGNAADGMRYVSMMVAAILIPLSFWWFRSVQEPGFVVVKKQQKTSFLNDMKHVGGNKTFLGLVVVIFTLAMGFNFVSLLGYYISIFYLFGGDVSAASTLLGINGTIWAITGLLAVFPLNWISRYFGKKKTLIMAILLMCLAQLTKIYCYNPAYPYLVIIPTMLLSCGMLFFFTLGSSMVGDICDDDDLRTNHRSEGSYYSVYWWFIKMGTAFASLVTGLLIMFTQFDEGQVVKVNDLQKSIGQISQKIEDWQLPLEGDGVNQDYLRNLTVLYNETLEQAIQFNTSLTRTRPEASSNIEVSERDLFVQQMSLRVQENITSLQQNQSSIEALSTATPHSQIVASIESAFPALVHTVLEKSSLNTFDLSSHLRSKSAQTQDNAQHYAQLDIKIASINTVIGKLTQDLLQGSITRDIFIEKIKQVEILASTLKTQSPYTLLWMRIIEIGLPLLLGLVSIMFALRYSLTEERCYEIKKLLQQRNKRLLQD